MGLGPGLPAGRGGSRPTCPPASTLRGPVRPGREAWTKSGARRQIDVHASPWPWAGREAWTHSRGHSVHPGRRRRSVDALAPPADSVQPWRRVGSGRAAECRSRPRANPGRGDSLAPVVSCGNGRFHHHCLFARQLSRAAPGWLDRCRSGRFGRAHPRQKCRGGEGRRDAHGPDRPAARRRPSPGGHGRLGRGPQRAAPLHRPRPRPGCHRPVAGGQVRHRTGDRGRLLLRLRSSRWRPLP